jgi:CDP-diacylglycerol--glycerol-3-phosphate 3-phosphatidyltransferase
MILTKASMVTLTRIALVPIFIWAMLSEVPYTGIAALFIFILASTTDWLDGFLARRYNEVTTFGKFIDPLADKLLITAAMLFFVQQGRMAVWAAMIIIARDFIVTSLRLVAVAQGQILAAEISGKIKMITQVVCCSFLLFPREAFPFLNLSGEFWNVYYAGSVYIMVAVTLWSGIDYLVRNRRVFKPAAEE